MSKAKRERLISEDVQEHEINMLELEDLTHTGLILTQLREMHKQGQFCDAKLIVGEHETHIHRAVLASASSYFFKMFKKGDEDDTSRSSFKLKDIEWETFKPLLDFIYTGRLSVADEQVKAVYKLSQNLRIHSATEACVQHLIEGLTPDNCLGIRSFAVEESFRDRVNQYIIENIRDVTQSKKFYGLLRISLEVVGSREENIKSASNDEVLQRILTWMKAKFPDVKNKLEALTEDLIVLYLNTDGSLTDCTEVDDESVQEDELVQDYKKLSRKKQSGKVAPTPDTPSTANYRKFNIEPYSPKEVEWSIVTSYKTKERTYTVIAMLNDKLVTMSVHYHAASSNGSGSETPDSPVHATSGSHLLEESVLELFPLKGMSTNRCAFGMKVLDGKLFACGGYDRGECLKSCEIYDVEANTWTPVADMRSARGRFSIAIHEDKVYAFGGSNGNSDMKTVECYDPSTDKWSIIAEAHRGKASPGLAVLQGKLYVVGGCIGQNTVGTCESLDLDTLQWESIAPMRIQRYQVAVTVFRKKIYAIGGTNGWKCLNEVEMYDPAVNEWSAMTQGLNLARRGAGVAIYEGKMYVVGGNDGQHALNSTEFYDPDTHAWSLGPNLGIPRANCGVAVVKDRLYAVGGFNGKKFLNSIEFCDLRKREHWRSHSVPVDNEVLKQNGECDASPQNGDVIAYGADVITNGADVIGNGVASGSGSESDDVSRNGDDVNLISKIKEGNQSKAVGEQSNSTKPSTGLCETSLKPDIQANGNRNS